MVVPGGRLPSEEALPTTTIALGTASQKPSATSGTIGMTTSGTTMATMMSSQDASSDRNLSGGAIAGIVVGGLAFIAGIGILLFYLGRHRTELEFLRRDIRNQDRGSSSPEVKVNPVFQAQETSTLRYSPDDPGIGTYTGNDVPPYSAHVGIPVSSTAELESPPLFPQPHRPWSDGTSTLQDVTSPTSRGFVDHRNTVPQQHELAGNGTSSTNG